MRIASLPLALVLASALVALLAACARPAPDAAPAPWTSAELDAVFDLSELGTLDRAADGSLRLGGRPLEPQRLRGQGYGRSFNHLRLDDATLERLAPEVRDFFLDASPDELREALARAGLTPFDVQRAWLRSARGEIGWSAFRQGMAVAAARGVRLDPLLRPAGSGR